MTSIKFTKQDLENLERIKIMHWEEVHGITVKPLKERMRYIEYEKAVQESLDYLNN